LNNQAEQDFRMVTFSRKTTGRSRVKRVVFPFEGSERIAQQVRKMIGRFRLLLLVLSMGFLSPLLLIRGTSEL
jgi:hypothetical protein